MVVSVEIERVGMTIVENMKCLIEIEIGHHKQTTNTIEIKH